MSPVNDGGELVISRESEIAKFFKQLKVHKSFEYDPRSSVKSKEKTCL